MKNSGSGVPSSGRSEASGSMGALGLRCQVAPSWQPWRSRDSTECKSRRAVMRSPCSLGSPSWKVSGLCLPHSLGLHPVGTPWQC